MKKYLIYAGGGAGVLQLINNEVFSWIVITAVAVVLFVKVFPIFLEGTK